MRYVSKTCCSSSNNGAEVPSKYTIMEPTHKDMPPPQMYNALQLLFLSKPYKNTEDYVDAFSLYKIPTNIYLLQRGTRIMPTMNIYQRWTKPTIHKLKPTNICTTTLVAPTFTHKDDPSVTPTPDTLYSSTPLRLLLITSLALQFRINPLFSTKQLTCPNPCYRSQSPYSSVQYALISVYNLLSPPKLTHLLFLLNSIVLFDGVFLFYFVCWFLHVG